MFSQKIKLIILKKEKKTMGLNIFLTLASFEEFIQTPNIISNAVKISPLNLSLVMSGYGAFSIFAQYSKMASLNAPIPEIKKK